MALRLIEMIIPQEKSDTVAETLKDQKILEFRQMRLSDKEVIVRILLDAQMSEGVLDLLSSKYTSVGERLVMLPVQATVPAEDIELDESGQPQQKKKPPARIGREELYETLKDTAKCSKVYLMMNLLAAIVATIGLRSNSVIILIGAMVIAPWIGPNMALALGETLGDLKLLRNAIITSLLGYAVALGFAIAFGLLTPIDPEIIKLAEQTHTVWGNIGVALASGCAAALSFTTAVPTILIGVMVSVSLLPPLVTFGLLLGGGRLELALLALSIFLMNVICINLAGVLTFLLQGIHPAKWWEEEHAKKATRIAIAIWAILLALLIAMLLFL